MRRHVVVDGSNIATEGRSTPSLKQLNEAVVSFMEEHPDIQVTVVVDATFGHRIDESERAEFEDAYAHGELTSPPAGAIGRGDAFVLRIAEKVNATVLSNDSFQEFHGEHAWLFEKDRLIGGKPVPGIGWVFTPRTPVRGPKSREATREAKRGQARVGSKEALQPMPVPKAPPPAKRSSKKVDDAIAVAVEEAVEPDVGKRRRRRRRGSGPPSEPVNDPVTFLKFVSDYQPGAEVAGEIDSFASHGAFVTAAGAKCYIPLSGMGDPPPKAAREVLERGETRTFVVQAFDTPRRGIELALPGFVHPAGGPTEETVEAEITEAHPEAAPVEDKPRKRAAKKKAAAPAKKVAAKNKAAAPAKKAAPAKRAAAKKKAAAEPAKKAAVKKKAATPTKKAAVKKTVATKATAQKAAPAKKAPTKKKAAPAKKAAAKKVVKKAAKKATKKSS
jgi:hypothetical protein